MRKSIGIITAVFLTSAGTSFADPLDDMLKIKDLKAYNAAYLEQRKRDPKPMQELKTSLELGYLNYVKVSKCHEKGLGRTAQDVEEIKNIVGYILYAEKVDPRLNKAVNRFAVESWDEEGMDESMINKEECAFVMTFNRAVLQNYYQGLLKQLQ